MTNCLRSTSLTLLPLLLGLVLVVTASAAHDNHPVASSKEYVRNANSLPLSKGNSQQSRSLRKGRNGQQGKKSDVETEDNIFSREESPSMGTIVAGHSLTTLTEPCLLTLFLINLGADGRDEEIVCEVRGNDLEAYGRRFLTIEGLAKRNAWTEQMDIDFGSTSFFVDGTTISQDGYLSLPSGATFDDVELDLMPSPTPMRRNVQELTPSVRSNVTTSSGVSRGLADCANTRTVLVVRVQAPDVSTTATTFQIGAELFTNPFTFASQFRSVSYDAECFVPTTERPNNADVVGGVYTVSLSSNIVGTQVNTVMSSIETKLDSDFADTNWQARFDHYFYIIPDGVLIGTSSTWVAFANKPGQRSVYRDNEFTHINTVMHEVGHNLQLDHSNDPAREIFTSNSGEYDDLSCIMGGSFTISSEQQEKKVFNAPKSFELGWYSNRVQTVSGSWSGRIYGIEDYASVVSPGLVVLRIQDSTDTYPDDIYVGFNRVTADGFNSQSNEGVNKVMITKRTKGDGKGTESFLEAELVEGGTYELPLFEGNEKLIITIAEISLDATPAYAEINVLTEEQFPTASPAPTNSMAPTMALNLDTSPLQGDRAGKGILFSMTAKNDLILEQFRLHLSGGTLSVRIWIKASPARTTPVDEFINENDWVLIQEQTVTGAGEDGLTLMDPLQDSASLSLTAGNTYFMAIFTGIDSSIFGDLASSNAISAENNDLALVGNALLTEDHPSSSVPNNYSGLSGFATYAFEGVISYSLDGLPTSSPSSFPSQSPTASPVPSLQPSPSPSTSLSPSSFPSSAPTASPVPSSQPSPSPSNSLAPSSSPSSPPSQSLKPSPYESAMPSLSTQPSLRPSPVPSGSPSTSVSPSAYPSGSPSASIAPSTQPSGKPSLSVSPSVLPSSTPSKSMMPTDSFMPSPSESASPSVSSMPSSSPSISPTSSPTASVAPSSLPSSRPSSSVSPSVLPSSGPSKSMMPSTSPSSSPSASITPSVQPSGMPSLSLSPSVHPTGAPTVSLMPSAQPSSSPTTAPVDSPSAGPSASPLSSPTAGPSALPSSVPSAGPSLSSSPSVMPTISETSSVDSSSSSSSSNSRSQSDSSKSKKVKSKSKSKKVKSKSKSTKEPTASPTLTEAPTKMPTNEPTRSPTKKGKRAVLV